MKTEIAENRYKHGCKLLFDEDLQPLSYDIKSLSLSPRIK
jgi:hypothetical protein